MKRLLLSALAVLGTSSSILAADVILDPAPVATLSGPSSLAGYVEGAIGGHTWTNVDYYEGSNEYGHSGLLLSGAARVAIPVASDFTVQLDGWVNAERNQAADCTVDCDWTEREIAGAAHLAYLLENGATLGGFVSVARKDNDGWSEWWVTGGLQAAVTFDNIRIYGQVGASRGGEVGYAATANGVFAHGTLAYYIDPNLKISASAGISREEWDGGWEDVNLNWGGKVEWKLDDSPITLFAAYEGERWDGSDLWGTWDGSSHAIKVGARFAFGDGTSTLRDLDNTVGLKDMNHLYGQQN
jgi:hypothetical protein